jgi:hypothetical protein
MIDSKGRPSLPPLVEVCWPDGSAAYLNCKQYCMLSPEVLWGSLVRLASADKRR